MNSNYPRSEPNASESPGFGRTMALLVACTYLILLGAPPYGPVEKVVGEDNAILVRIAITAIGVVLLVPSMKLLWRASVWKLGQKVRLVIASSVVISLIGNLVFALTLSSEDPAFVIKSTLFGVGFFFACFGVVLSILWRVAAVKKRRTSLVVVASHGVGGNSTAATKVPTPAELTTQREALIEGER